MTRRIGLLAALLMTLVLVACQPAGPAVLSDADRSAIEASAQAFLTAARAGDWAGVAAVYTEDAVLMPPNAPAVEGKSAIQAFFTAMPPVTAFDLQAVEIDGRGDLAYVRGTYTMTITLPDGTPISDAGKYLEIHRRQPDGSWPLYRDMFNSDVAMPQPPQ